MTSLLKSPELIRQFDAFGFLLLPRVFSALDLAQIRKEYDSVYANYREIVPTDGKYSPFNRFLMDDDTPFIASLVDNSLLSDFAELLLQRRCICIHIAGRAYDGATPWHTDNPDMAFDGVKFVLYLDPHDGDSGALRVIPRSHKYPLSKECNHINDTETLFGLAPHEIPATVLDSTPGDLIAFCHSLWHASFHGGRGRRAIEFNYYPDPASPTEIDSFICQMRRNHKPSSRLGQQMYPESWRRSNDRRHQSWIARLRQFGVLETPVAGRGS